MPRPASWRHRVGRDRWADRPLAVGHEFDKCANVAGVQEKCSGRRKPEQHCLHRTLWYTAHGLLDYSWQVLQNLILGPGEAIRLLRIK